MDENKKMDELNIFEFSMEEQKQISEYEASLLESLNKNRRRTGWAFVIVAVILVITVFVSFMLGRYAVHPFDVMKILMSQIFPIEQTWEATYETVVMSVRVPRVLAALAVGGSLAVAGATYQGLFRNPMVSPDLLGASAGASVGACLMMLLSLGAVFVQGAAFVMGLVAVGISYTLSKAIGRGNNMIMLLVLCGMTVSTLFQAIVSIIKYLADTESQLPEMTYWLMGSIAKVSYNDLKFFLIPFLIGVVPILLLRWKINILSFGEDEAKAMGINVTRIRLTCIVCATILTASVVSIAGVVGWVGLMIPHLVRFIVGPNNKSLVPMSILVGATFMLVIDNICRSLLAYEIPLGVLTSLLGAPFFIFILFKRKGKA